MNTALLRLLRILVAQILGILANLSFNIPYLGITIGAVINAIFKYIRDKYPKSKLLEWLPL
jgi:hypothetical protein